MCESEISDLAFKKHRYCFKGYFYVGMRNIQKFYPRLHVLTKCFEFSLTRHATRVVDQLRVWLRASKQHAGYGLPRDP